MSDEQTGHERMTLPATDEHPEILLQDEDGESHHSLDDPRPIPVEPKGAPDPEEYERTRTRQRKEAAEAAGVEVADLPPEGSENA